MTRFENVGVYSNILKSSHSSFLPAYEDGTECSETSTYNIQAPGNYSEERIQHSEQSESLKSRTQESVMKSSRKFSQRQ
jgi:hypothetical protein